MQVEERRSGARIYRLRLPRDLPRQATSLNSKCRFLKQEFFRRGDIFGLSPVCSKGKIDQWNIRHAFVRSHARIESQKWDISTRYRRIKL